MLPSHPAVEFCIDDNRQLVKLQHISEPLVLPISEVFTFRTGMYPRLVHIIHATDLGIYVDALLAISLFVHPVKIAPEQEEENNVKGRHRHN